MAGTIFVVGFFAAPFVLPGSPGVILVTNTFGTVLPGGANRSLVLVLVPVVVATIEAAIELVFAVVVVAVLANQLS